MDHIRLYVPSIEISSSSTSLQRENAGYFQLPLKLIWFSSVFIVIGGGPAVAVAIIFTMVSDVVPTENRWSVLFRSDFPLTLAAFP